MSVFRTWARHFKQNTQHFARVRWSTQSMITPEEKKAIASSVQQFELGESSEGYHLKRTAESFSSLYPEFADYAEAIRHFIAEENSHSRALRTFMDQESIPALRGHMLDAIFRFVRKLSGVEMEVRVLVTAEIIAMAYYDALNRATQSLTLRDICDVILHDEQSHLAFQAQTIGIINRRATGVIFALKSALHACFMLTTIAAVWLSTHRKVFARAGYTFSSYAHCVLMHYYATMNNAHHFAKAEIATKVALSV